MTRQKTAIVSSSHLASEQGADLSELEYGLIIANHAFQRWMSRCMSAAGMEDLSATDIMILHNVYHRQRAKRIADICFSLNIEDTHTAAYALRKLVKRKLVKNQKQGKENFYSVTAKGEALCEKYREIREHCLVDALGALGGNNRNLSEIAQVLRSLSGLYDQAARSAASL